MTYGIDPQDIDPETNRPYANYSSPALDTSFHDGEMDVDEGPCTFCNGALRVVMFKGTEFERSERCLPCDPEPEECEHCGGDGLEPASYSFDAGDGEGEDRPCSVCSA